MTRLSFRPGVEFGDVNDDLTIGREFDLGAVHGTRSWTFEVDAFAVVAAAVAWAFEFVFARFPVGRAAQVSAARVNHEQAIGRAVNPNAIFLLPLRIDTKRVVRGITDLERSARLEQGARQEEAEKRQEPRDQERRDADPCQSTAALIDFFILRSDRGNAASGRSFGGADRRSSYILVRRRAGSVLFCLRILFDRIGLPIEFLLFDLRLIGCHQGRRHILLVR